MAIKSFYVDSCIYLNLWKKELGPDPDKPHWQIAKDFIEDVSLSYDKEIVYSGIVLKELRFHSKPTMFSGFLSDIKKERFFRSVPILREDFSLARKLESKFNYEISYFDCIHIAICKRLNLTLVTRDNKLIRSSKELIDVKKPEQLLT